MRCFQFVHRCGFAWLALVAGGVWGEESLSISVGDSRIAVSVLRETKRSGPARLGQGNDQAPAGMAG
jgi:hypothetical protein